MTEQQRQEAIEFFKNEDLKANLQSLAFRLLCFSYDTERNKKSWINYEQGDNAPWQAILVLGDNAYRFHCLQTVEEVLSQLTSK